MEFRIWNRELSAIEIIDRSFGLYQKRLMEFLVPFLLSGVINAMIRQAAGYFFPPIIMPRGLTERFFEWFMSHLGMLVTAVFISWVPFWIISAIVNGIAVKYASDLLKKGDASLWTAFSSTVDKLVPLLINGLISSVLMILGFICFVVPGIIVAIIFALIVPVVMIEDSGPFESFERSRRLVDKSWWKTFKVLLLVWLAIGLITLVGEAFSYFYPLFGGLVSTLIVALIHPIHPIALTYLYYSMLAKEEATQPHGYKLPTSPEITEQPPIIPKQPSFCIFCGQRLPPDALFCPRCGSKIKDNYKG